MIEIAPTDLYFFAVVAPERQDSAVHDYTLTWAQGKRTGVVRPIARLPLTLALPLSLTLTLTPTLTPNLTPSPNPNPNPDPDPDPNPNPNPDP